MTEQPLYDIEGMAIALRQCFIENWKIARNSRHYKPDKRHDHPANWKRAAENCLRLGANPRDYVDAAFSLCKLPAGPFANQLTGPAAEAWYRSYTGEKKHRIEVATTGTPEAQRDMLSESVLMEEVKDELMLAHELMAHITGSSSAWTAAPVLNNPFTSIRPHIRVAIAGRAGLTTVTTKFAAEARDYLSTRPGVTECLRVLGYPMETYLNAVQPATR